MSVADGTLLDSLSIEFPQSSLSIFKRSISDDEFHRLTSTRLYSITYASAGLRIRGFMALPPAEEGRLPAIIFNRGGTKRGALTPASAAQYLGLYASWGYVAVASQYRGSGGSEGPEEWGGGDVDDVMNLFKLLSALEYVDPDRIGIVGGSRGGMMAMQMLRRTNLLRAAVTFGAPAYFETLAPTAYIRRLMMRFVSPDMDFAAEAHRRSALHWADEMDKTTPLLVLHGSGDRRVAPEHALKLGLELQRCRHPYKLIIYDNADHILAGRRTQSNRDIREWLDMYVKQRRALPRVGPHGA